MTESPSQILKNASVNMLPKSAHTADLSITSIKEHDTVMVDVFSPPNVPDRTPEIFKITYKIQKCVKVTMKEVPDDGSVRHLRPSQRQVQMPILRHTYSCEICDSGSCPFVPAGPFVPLGVPTNTPQYSPSSFIPYEFQRHDGHDRLAPPLDQAKLALRDLDILLRGESRGKGGGYKDPGFNPWVSHRLNGMAQLLRTYVREDSLLHNKWGAAACQTAVSLGRGLYCARTLVKMCRQYINDQTVLPVNPYGDWNESMIEDDGIAQDLAIHLQSLGKDITARKVVEFLSRNDVMEKHGITKKITVRTARRYLRAMGYRFQNPKKGQYCDGHEREDVVWYRQNIYIPKVQELDLRRVHFNNDGDQEEGPLAAPGCRVIKWYHDECIFYAHDRRRKGWVHKDASAVPYKKGDGPSLMVADFVSADFGWLASEDGLRTARRFLRPGKNRDGYFTNEDLEEQAIAAMDIVTETWPEYEHVFIYDNATTHLKRPDGALSARKMPKTTKHWLVEVTRRDPVTNKPVYTPEGKLQKEKIPMANTVFNGVPQMLYYSHEHEKACQFKGMQVLLEERGYADAGKLRYECNGFKCPPGATNCCCRRLLYTQPDFVHVPSLLETVFQNRGFKMMFLPKFHCELNFIEQCWGYAKRIYRLNPESSREDHLQKYAKEALDCVPLMSMRR
jgi:hypothetical protein